MQDHIWMPVSVVIVGLWGSVSRAHRNWASQRLVGKVWCTPRVLGTCRCARDVWPLALLTLEVLGEDRSWDMLWSCDRMLCLAGPPPLPDFTVRQSAT